MHLVRDGGEQHTPEFREVNPQGLVPVLQHGSRMMRQSLAILEYLDETWPTPPLLPTTARDRARVRALAQAIACDIHPLNNLRVLQYFEHDWHVPQPERDDWVGTGSPRASRAIEAMLADHPSTGALLRGRHADHRRLLPGAAGLQRAPLRRGHGGVSRPSRASSRPAWRCRRSTRRGRKAAGRRRSRVSARQTARPSGRVRTSKRRIASPVE